MNRSSVEFGAVQGCDCRFRGGILCHLDKRKTSGLACFPIRHDSEPFHGSMFIKHGSNVLFGGIGAEVSHKNIVHLLSPCARKSGVHLGDWFQLAVAGLACSSHSTG